jgi:hypothetical protein
MFYKTLLVLGIIAAIAVLIYGSGGLTQPFAPTVPQFVNPFEKPPEVLGTISGILDSPVDFITGDGLNFGLGAFSSFIGCNNNTIDRANCLNTRDGINSYMRIGKTLTNGTGIYFNWTGAVLDDYYTTRIRSITVTLDCWSDRNDVKVPQIGFGFFGSTVGFTSCPKGLQPVTSVLQMQTSGGLSAHITTNNSHGFELALVINPDYYLGTVLTTPERYANISYVRYDVQVDLSNGTAGCQAPQGAWFPWLDETACSILQFGDLVWKGIQFAINGVFWIGGWFIFMGQTIGNYIAVIVWLYQIPDMPILIQGFVDVVLTIWIIVIVVEGYKKISPFTSG